MVAKLTRLTHKIAIKLHLVAESCTICSSRSRRPVRKLFMHHPLCVCVHYFEIRGLLTRQNLKVVVQIILIHKKL
jgi:hypothetical protein